LRPLADARGSDRTSDRSRERQRAAGANGQPNSGRERAVPLAYLITFTCYGTWLHGKDPFSVDRDHNIPWTPFVAANCKREESEQRRMDQPPYELDAPRRQVVLNAIREVAEHRGWELYAAHVRTTHVHVVVGAGSSVGAASVSERREKIMNDFKGYASRGLNKAGFENSERKRWTRHGSNPYLWEPRDVEAAVHYVLHEQGEPMAVFDGTNQSRERERAVGERAVGEGGGRERAVAAGAARVEFEIFEPKSEAEVGGGTVTRGNAVCPCCHVVLPVARVRDQLRAQRGGADVIFDDRGRRIGGARLLAVVTLANGGGSPTDRGRPLADARGSDSDDRAASVSERGVSERGRQYRLPTERDYEAVWKAQRRLKKLLDDWERAGRRGLCPVPDEPLPPVGTLGFRVQRYGMLQWGDLFTARQKLAMSTLAKLVGSSDCPQGVAGLLALTLDRVCSRSSSLCLWRYHADQEKVEHIFGRQALPVVWDFAESMPLSASTGSLSDGVEVVAQAVEDLAGLPPVLGQTHQADARECPLGDASASTWLTDPPYYDAVPYADLSDFFFVWLQRTLPNHPLLRNPFEPGNPLAPKCPEIVQDEVKHTQDGRPKDRAFFEESMQKAFAEGRRVLKDEGVGAVVFAHKTTEGWEALISGMLKGGWIVTGSWPITTEMANRLRARESAALSASIHLVCRPRPEDAGIGGWEQILSDLPGSIGDWMERFSTEGIRGADLVFSCIGPALELFSKYDKVETAAGRQVKLDEFLAKVWEVVGRTALQQVLGTAEAKARNSAAGALEEDARLTALFLWTLQTTNANGAASVSERGVSERGVSERGVSTSDRDSNGVASDSEAEGGEGEEEPLADARGSEEAHGSGPVLLYDVVRRFAQPLGIHLETWEGRIIETKKGTVRLIPVQERREKLFGEAGTDAVAQAIERSHGESPQFALFPDEERVPDVPIKTRKTGRGRKAGVAGAEGKPALPREATTLDRVHAAMLLQAGGQATALRAMLETETQRSPDFLRLANALSALYPKESEEKRLLDAMLLAVPR
jgi:REP element-mobilizing transposase RayT